MNDQEKKIDSNLQSSADLRVHIEHEYDQVRSFMANRGNDRLRSRWPEWEERFQLLLQRLDQRPEVAISLVGGTGAGKSTLLNAIIGLRVLPVGNMRACTAAICEVGYGEGPLSARIEFISRESWEKEVNVLLADFRDTQTRPDSLKPDAASANTPMLSQSGGLPNDNVLAAMNKVGLMALAATNGVYILMNSGVASMRKQLAAERDKREQVRLDNARKVSGAAAIQYKDEVEDEAAGPLMQMARDVREKLWTVYRLSEDSDFESFDPLNFVEPAEIKAALDAGFEEISNSDVKEFRKQVARYLESKHRFWPIVKSIAIRGPFETLRDGAKIIDLPGINDPNESREVVTKEHLKTCRFVWLVFNIKRVLTKDIYELMQSEDFMRQIVMDGRADTLTFIGTASDDINPETAREEFGLDEEAPVMDAVAARNRAVRKVVQGQLANLSSRLAELASEQRDTAIRLKARLGQSRIFTVSAQEYLRLCGLMKTNPAGFSSIDQAEIPALIAHMQQICSTHGIAAECQSIQRQLELIHAEIHGELQAQQAMLKNRADATERGQKEVRAAIEAAQTFLGRDLEDTREHLVQDLESGKSILAERVKRAVERARNDLEQTLTRWNQMHAGTIKAICHRGGAHKGVQHNDFPADLSKPILDGIAFAWSDLFGEKLIQIMEKWTDRLLKNADEYRGRLVKSLTAAADVSASAVASLDRIFATAEKILREILAQAKNKMDERILHDQRTLYERVPDQVRANMKVAFERAADEKGMGVRQRIVAILEKHARQVSQVMFDDARQAILEGIGGLNDWLAREFEKMIEAIQRNASLAADNMVSGGERMTADAIAAEHAMLKDLAKLLATLQQGAAA